MHLADLAGYLRLRGYTAPIHLLDWNREVNHEWLTAGTDLWSALKAPDLFTDPVHYARILEQLWAAWLTPQQAVNNALDAYISASEANPDLPIPPFIQTFCDLPAIRDAAIVAFSLTYHHKDGISQFFTTIAAIIALKRHYPDKKLILGGSLANGLHPPDRLMAAIPEIDAVFFREPDESFFQYVNSQGTETELPNMMSRTENGLTPLIFADNVVRTPVVLPAVELLDPDNYPVAVPVAMIQFRRGCPWSGCAFCTQHQPYFGYEKDKPVDHLTARFRHLVNAGYRHIYLADQMITPTLAHQIADALIRENLGVIWSVMAMPQAGYTPALLTKLRKSGCVWITWGMESASPRILRTMGKPINPKTAKRIITDSHLAGIANVILMITHYPGETPDDIAESLAFLSELRPYYYDHSQSPFFLMAGAPVSNAIPATAIPIAAYRGITIPSPLLVPDSPFETHPWPEQEWQHTVPFAEHMLGQRS